MLREIGIYGYDEIENAIKCALVTGDPLLLIGDHGSAKTALSENLAAALNLKYHSYDASRAMFEDIVGFPDPNTFKDGKIDYIKTPMSIWDKEFVLIDEISRAQVSMQNKWLELIRSRKMMGVEVKPLKYIFAAMNPHTYLGAEPLDDALIGRFAIFIDMPKLDSMEENDILQIAKTIGKDDAVCLNYERNKKLSGHKNKIINEIEEIRKGMKSPKIQKEAENFCLTLRKMMMEENVHVDGRRLGMLFRNYTVFSSINDKRDFKNTVHETIKYSIPFNINEETMTERQIDKLIRNLSLEMLKEKKKVFYFNSSDLRSSAESFVKCMCDMSKQETENAVLKFAEMISEIERQGATDRIFECYDSLTTILFNQGEMLPSNQQEILLEKISELSSSKSIMGRTFKCSDRTFESEKEFLALLISIALVCKVKGSERNVENFLPQVLKNI